MFHQMSETEARLRSSERYVDASEQRLVAIARADARRRDGRLPRITRMRLRSMRPVLQGLAVVPLFQGLTRRELAFLARMADPFQLSAGERVGRVGSRAQVVVLAEGRARAILPAGGTAELAEGSVIGSPSMIEAAGGPSTVVALDDLSGFVFGRAQFWDALTAIPRLGARMMVEVARELREIRPATQPDIWLETSRTLQDVHA